jgi:hypothetical protein
VPVTIMSPACSVMVSDRIETRSADAEEHVARIYRSERSLRSAALDLQPLRARRQLVGRDELRPKAPVESKFLPIVHCVVFIW